MNDNSLYSIKEIKAALINLYLNVKVRRADEISKCDGDFLKAERENLKDIDIMVLIGYIKTSIEILINLKEEDRKEETQSLASERSYTGMQKGYNEMLQNLESELRMHIRVIVYSHNRQSNS